MSAGVATVKEVLSADTLILVGAPKGGPPPEKRVSLSSLIAPKVALKTMANCTDDEPYAWTAREFVRKKFIGKQVEFTIDHNVGDRQFSTIIFEGENIAHEILRRGFAKLKSANSNPSPDYNSLEESQTKAKTKNLGIWCDDSNTAQATVRSVKWAVGDASLVKEFAQQNKDKNLKCLVEYVRDCGSYRLFFYDSCVYAGLTLSGILGSGSIREVLNDGSEVFVPDPFAEEAKYFVEMRVLNRELDARIEGSTESGNLYGSLYHPNGNISLLLLQNGFVKINDMTAKLTESPALLRQAMKQGQQNRLRKWKEWKAPVLDTEKNYEARVVEVISGDSYQLALQDGTERRIYLASTRCPKMGNRNKEDEPWAQQAKEAARKKIIGRDVKVILEYTTEPTRSASGSPLPVLSDSKGRMHFVSIMTDKNKTNLAQMLLSMGLAYTISHKAEDERAENFDQLLEVEKTAKGQSKGIHGSDKLAPRTRLVDLCGSENAVRTRSYSNELHLRDIHGIVQYVVTASKFRIRVPNHNLVLSFQLAAVHTPATARPAQPGQKPKDSQPFAEESLKYTRDCLLQRDVTIYIDTCDKGGNFIGVLTHNKKNYAEHLLEIGYACVSERAGSRKMAYDAIEEKARAARVKIWSVPVPVDLCDASTDVDINELLKHVVISHVAAMDSFYIQVGNSSNLKKIHSILDDPDVAVNADSVDSLPAKGDVLIGQFSADNKWYRLKVTEQDRSRRMCHVTYIDYGNGEKLTLTKMRRLPERLNIKEFPVEAKLCCMSGLLPPRDKDFVVEAAQIFHEETVGREFNCLIESLESGVHSVVLTEEQEGVDPKCQSLNEKFLRMGLAMFDKKSSSKIFKRLQAAEETARKGRVNLWRYGDVGSDDEQDGFPSLANGRRNPKKR